MKDTLRLADDAVGALWHFASRPGNQRASHHHDELEFNFVISGSGSYLLDDRRVDISAGSIIWLFPEQEHLLINESEDFAMWIAVFKPEAVADWCKKEER